MTDQWTDKIERLRACASQDEAMEYLMRFSGDDRRQVVLRTGAKTLHWLPLQEETLGAPNTEMIIPLYERNAQETTSEQIRNFYKSLFFLIYSAKKQAEEEGKPLHIITGENHIDRNAFLINLMILCITKRLEISDFGLEVPLLGTKQRGKKIYGYDSLSKQVIKGTLPLDDLDPEHSLMPGDKRMHRGPYIFFAKEIGMKIFPADSEEHKIDYSKNPTIKEIYYNRDKAAAKKLNEEKQEKSYVCILGVNHLEGLPELIKSSGNTLVIDTASQASLHKTKYDFPTKKNCIAAVNLPSDFEEAIELGKNVTWEKDARRIVYAKVSGFGIQYSKEIDPKESIRAAIAMAREVDKILGPELMAEIEERFAAQQKSSVKRGLTKMDQAVREHGQAIGGVMFGLGAAALAGALANDNHEQPQTLNHPQNGQTNQKQGQPGWKKFAFVAGTILTLLGGVAFARSLLNDKDHANKQAKRTES